MKKTILISTLVVLAGCSMWENFTTYFNAYYNATIAFEEAIDQVKADQQNLFEFKVTKLNGTAKKKFEIVVEKCSRILQFNSTSSYVPGALFMIGRAFYFQQEFPKASRKFQELKALNNEDYELRDLLWIGKTELQSRNFKFGLSILDSVKEKATIQENDELLVQAYNAQISYHIYNEDYYVAVNLINKMVSVSENEELNAEAFFELGRVYLKIDSLGKAADAFLAVDNYTPTFETDFNSKLEYATVKRKLGKVDESLSILEDMESQNKFVKKRAQIELEIANIYRDRGNIDEAISKYMEVDSVYKRTESAGYASYNIAKLLQDSLMLYDSAMVFYAKTMSSTVPREMKTKVQKESNIVAKYLDFSDKQLKYEQDLTYVLYPKIFVQDSLDYEFYMGNDTSSTAESSLSDSTKADSTSVVNTAQQQQQNQQNLFAESLKNLNKPIIPKPIRPKVSADSLIHTLSKIRFSIGNMFQGDLNVPDSGYYYYNLILEDDPDGPYTASALFSLGTFYSSINDSTSADSLFKLVYDNYKTDPIAVEAARRLGQKDDEITSDNTQKLYVDAENLYFNGNFDEAISKFYSIAKQFPKSSMAPKSLYAIGYLYENYLNKPDSAQIVFTLLKRKYTRSEYTLAIIPQLNAYKKEQNRIAKAVKDSIAKIRRDSIALVKAKSLKEKAIRDSLTALNLKNNKNPILSSLKDSSKIKRDSLDVKKDSTKIKKPPFPKIPSLKTKSKLKKKNP